MRIRLVIGPGNRWTFQAEPEGEREARAEFSAGPEGVITRLWQRLLAEYRHARRAIETSERMGWIQRWLRRLEARIDPNESLLRHMRTAAEIVLLYPASLSATLVQRRFLRFLRRQSRAHTRGIVLNALLLPVTAALAVLPGPNVFFAWNAYRLIAHLLARQGARRILRGACPVRLHSVAGGDTVVGVSPGSPRDLRERS
ncbi:MAG: mitochondrial K+-H+ exchange-related family protein [Blastocatellia bacterium]|nr:mitochondrial K+-H+ exchange-related family protein [Blastocatellia bacterium]MCS7157589.1 mitochondrial K+-H+ exchange-related family protein [Blastocatellia bacterium]MCX7751854.1 mitochondrial K+-H+ exchange-related family protein [Blastocatellia bacterium]MDW8166960.1 hypothetical protein [Acidobacteriota bacterium]MDW8257064.1 hypothetical protein [Acidobacteriota bacterium]